MSRSTMLDDGPQAQPLINLDFLEKSCKYKEQMFAIITNGQIGP